MKAAITTHDGVILNIVEVLDERALKCVLVGGHPKVMLPEGSKAKVGDTIGKPAKKKAKAKA